MDKEEIQLLITVASVVLLVLFFTLVALFLFFYKKKTQYKIEKQKIAEKFNRELLQSQIEIKEQTCKNISWEIHDNVGQLLSVAKLQLNLLGSKLQNGQKEEVIDVENLISDSLKELRGLAKSLNPEVIKNVGLIESISMELDRFNRLKFITSKLTITGEPSGLTNEKEIILFRILQEFFHNTLKHSKGSELNVLVDFDESSFEIVAEDNGVGFDMNEQHQLKGIGLLNMKSRAQLINADLSLISEKGKGTMLKIKCPIEN